jgi:hypothetical protein
MLFATILFSQQTLMPLVRFSAFVPILAKQRHNLVLDAMIVRVLSRVLTRKIAKIAMADRAASPQIAIVCDCLIEGAEHLPHVDDQGFWDFASYHEIVELFGIETGSDIKKLETTTQSVVNERQRAISGIHQP